MTKQSHMILPWILPLRQHTTCIHTCSIGNLLSGDCWGLGSCSYKATDDAQGFTLHFQSLNNIEGFYLQIVLPKRFMN